MHHTVPIIANIPCQSDCLGKAMSRDTQLHACFAVFHIQMSKFLLKLASHKARISCTGGGEGGEGGQTSTFIAMHA